MCPAPRSRNDFEVAIICALPIEYDAVWLLIDQFWDEDGNQYGQAVGDYNRYTTGRMGNTDIVLLLLPRIGKASAARAAEGLRLSYSRLRLVLLTGICGGAPTTTKGEEVLLGDVVISKNIVQHDFGRQNTDGFATKDKIEDVLGPLPRDIQNLVTYLETVAGRSRLQGRANTILQALQNHVLARQRGTTYDYPGAEQDRLFKADYPHKHYAPTTCVCAHHRGGTDPICETSRTLACETVGCDDAYIVSRKRVEGKRQLEREGRQPEAQAPLAFIGRVGSSDMVVRCGEDRDRLIELHKVVGFEMEGAGVWGELPCLIVKGVCDYADSHKNKGWQDFAAATAASTAKALLAQFIGTETAVAAVPSGVKQGGTGGLRDGQPCFSVPFSKNKRFVGRTIILKTLVEKLFTEEARRRVALVGLGGIGKTQVALQLAYWAKKNRPEYSVFWVPAWSDASFEQACTEMMRKLGIQHAQHDDPKEMVQQYLNSGKAGPWLLVVDNADNMEVLFGPRDSPGGLDDYLPDSDDGCILVTTRSMDVAMKVADDDVVELDEMSRDEGVSFLGKMSLQQGLLANDAAVTELLQELTYLPLAISQAAAYLKRNRITIAAYLELMRGTPQDVIGLMSSEVPNHTRSTGSQKTGPQNAGPQNPVATTWLVSFEQIRKSDPEAADLLSFMSCIEPKGIPVSMLPVSETKEQLVRSIGTLYGYAFVSKRDDREMLDMHNLVHLATAIWVDREGFTEERMQSVTEHLADVFPSDDWANRETWREYLPHAIKVLGARRGVEDVETSKLGYWTGRCLQVDGRVGEAVEQLKHVVTVRKRTLAEEHPDRLASQHTLAGAYEANGQVKEAVEMLEHVVTVRKRMLAEEHPDRLASQHELAGAYQANGQVKKAVKMLEHVVTVRKRMLMEEHPNRLASQHALAGAYKANGQVKKAVEMLEHVVTVRKRMLVEEHPDRLASQHALAGAYEANGQVKEAVEMLEHVVMVWKRTLAEEHPSRLASQHALGGAYQANGQVKKAVKILEYVVMVRKRTLAEEHPDRLASQQAYRKIGIVATVR